MIDWVKETEEVYYASKMIPTLSKNEIDFLINESKKNKRKRCRVCMHKNKKDISQEMFIVHLNECYIRPHKHIDKVESMSVIKGEADAIFFNNNGDIIDKIELGEFSSGKKFYYRINKNIYHMLIIRSDYFVFQENTLGPFFENALIFPDWAPELYDQSFIDQIIKN